MKDEPVYYINHFSLLKRPAIWSKYEYWIINTASFGIYVLFLVALTWLGRDPVWWTGMMVIVIIPGWGYNFHRGRERAKRYSQYWQGTIPVT